MKIDDAKFAELVAKFLDVPYKLGGMSFKGMDCVSFIYLFNKLYGVDLPEGLGSYKFIDYQEIYKKMGAKGKEIFADYIRSFTKEADKPQKGDILIMKNNSGEYMFAIFIGNNNILFNDVKLGNIVLPLSSIETNYTEIRRIE